MEERSAGAVIFRRTPRGRVYLLLQNAGRWDFPKGGIEEGEGETDTARREVEEEAGLKNLMFLPGFQEVIEYFYRRDNKNIHKQVTYLLAETEEEQVRISHEHQAFGWFEYPEALDKASYDNSKRILAEAERFILKGEGGPRTRPEGGRPAASPP